MALSECVIIQQDLLTLGLAFLRNDRRLPRVLAFGDRNTAAKAIFLTLFGASVVPIVPRARRHGHIGLLHAGLNLFKHIFRQLLQMCGFRLGISVLDRKSTRLNSSHVSISSA